MKIRLATCRGTPFPDPAPYVALQPNATIEEAKQCRHAVDRIDVPKHALNTAHERLWTYGIFAPGRMESRVCTPEGRITLGATIIQRIFVGPIAIETAVRVISCTANGFEYITLPGHPEFGIARFTLNDSQFAIESWSRPGSWLTMLGGPITRWMQRTSTQRALQRMAGSINSLT